MDNPIADVFYRSIGFSVDFDSENSSHFLRLELNKRITLVKIKNAQGSSPKSIFCVFPLLTDYKLTRTFPEVTAVDLHRILCVLLDDASNVE
jgi:hypothetical protein